MSMLMEGLYEFCPLPFSYSPQCSASSCYSDNSEARQQLQHQRLLGASTQ